jgi:hypothetical protein
MWETGLETQTQIELYTKTRPRSGTFEWPPNLGAVGSFEWAKGLGRLSGDVFGLRAR